MATWLVVLILGFVEGLTEFIPVSSTGHLLIAEHWLPRQSDLFNVVIQGGAVLAVLPLFKDRLKMLSHLQERASQTFLAKIVVACIVTGIPGFIMEKKGFKLPEEVGPVAWGACDRRRGLHRGGDAASGQENHGPNFLDGGNRRRRRAIDCRASSRVIPLRFHHHAGAHSRRGAPGGHGVFLSRRHSYHAGRDGFKAL